LCDGITFAVQHTFSFHALILPSALSGFSLVFGGTAFAPTQSVQNMREFFKAGLMPCLVCVPRVICGCVSEHVESASSQHNICHDGVPDVLACMHIFANGMHVTLHAPIGCGGRWGGEGELLHEPSQSQCGRHDGSCSMGGILLYTTRRCGGLPAEVRH
jgi:hypothetical protein